MNAFTTCAEDGCARCAADGHVMWRVNTKGQKGIFMCGEHAEAVEREAIAKDRAR